MTLSDFATKYNLRLRKDRQDDTEVVQGRNGQIYSYGPAELGVMILSPGNPRIRRWTSIKKKCASVGMTLRQNGEGEGALSFDPENKQHARMAIKAAGVRPKK